MQSLQSAYNPTRRTSSTAKIHMQGAKTAMGWMDFVLKQQSSKSLNEACGLHSEVIVIAPGDVYAPAFRAEITLYVLKGNAESLAGKYLDERETLGAGDLLYIASHSPQCVRNLSETEPVHIIVMRTESRLPLSPLSIQ